MEQDIFTDSKYKAALWDASPIGICLLHRTGRFLRANPAFCQTAQFTESELRNRTFQSILARDDVSAYHGEARKLGREQEKDGSYLCPRLTRKDGGYIHVEAYTFALRDAGQLEGFIVHVVPLPQSGYRVEESDGGVAVRPVFNLWSFIAENPKTSLALLGLLLVAARLLSVEHLKAIIDLVM